MRARLLVGAALVSTPGIAQIPQSDGVFEAAWDSISGGSGETVFERPIFTDGTDLVAAARGTYTETEAGDRDWALDGELRVTLGTAELVGERGSFRFNAAGELIRGSISGQPISLSAIDSETNEAFHGSAGTISLERSDAGEHNWTLDGELRVALGTAELAGEGGRFEFNAAGELIRGSISGQPVSLSATESETGETFRGSAGTFSLERSDAGEHNWTLDGELRVAFGTAELVGERGSFKFNTAGELIRGSISGLPVSLSAIDSESGESFRGNASAFSLERYGSGDRHWTLEGDLQVAIGAAELVGERGSFEFNAAGELIRGSISGLPVSLSALDVEENRSFIGSAETVSMDADSRTLQLLGSAVLSVRSGEYEPSTYQGCDWIYNWDNHSFRKGSSDCGVQLILAPIRDDQDSDATTVTP